MNSRINKKAILWGIPTGVLFSTSYPPFPAWALFFAFAPLWVYWARCTRLRDVIVSGFVAQFLFTLIGFNWIAHTATEFGHIPIILSIFVLIGFCLFASLNLVFAGVCVFFINKRWPLKTHSYFIFLAVMCGVWDWVFPMIFPWNTGYPLYFSHFRSAQLAEYIGFWGLGVLTYLANACFALALLKCPQKNWSRPLIVFLAGLFCTEFGGHLTLNKLEKDDQNVKVLLIQPNIGNFDKFYAERGNGFQEPVVRKLFEQTLEGLKNAKEKPDFIVWPETAYPASLDPYFTDAFYVKQLKDFVAQQNIPLLAGGYSEDPPGTPRPKTYNGLFEFEPGKSLKPGYRKVLLLAFGEYFPGAEYIPFLKDMIPEISDFGRGVGPSVFTIGRVSVTPQICYEGLDTAYIRKEVGAGGQILVNVTNDSWFGTFFEPYQHMYMTAARTIEYRRPLIRVTNTGISSVINRKGEVLIKSPQDIPWATVAEVPFLSQPANTVYYNLQPAYLFILLGLLALIFFTGRLKK